MKFHISTMNECFILIFLVFFIFGAFTVKITSPGLKRKLIGESCKLQWTVTGTFTNYTIESLANGNPVPLTYSYRRNTAFDRKKGVITLQIWNIELTDAADYQLHIRTGSSPASYSNGTLFVYAPPTFSQITLVSGPNPGKEGDNFEFSCKFVSTSEPAKYRTRVYYSWVVLLFSFQNISSGPEITVNGDVMPRYTIKNNGSTLVTTSAIYGDNCVDCLCQEEGSPYKTRTRNFLYCYFDMQNRPYTYEFNPPSKKLTTSLYSGTITFMKFTSQPTIASYTNWSFVNSNGTSRELPVPNDPIKDEYVNLEVLVNSAESYGNYSITLTNIHGSRTETLQVLPPGRPDAPSLFSVQYVTHNVISLQWYCMWNNGYPQTVFVQLVEVASNTDIDKLASAPENNCYSSLMVTIFRQNLQPDTQYQAVIWSSNQLGSSDKQSLIVTTQIRPSLNVSCENIVITDSQAVITVSTSYPDVVWLNVTCCTDLTDECVVQSYTLSNTTSVNQVVVDNLPLGINYIFDFTLFNGNFYNYVYVLAVLKGVRVSTISPCIRSPDTPVVGINYVTHFSISILWTCMLSNYVNGDQTIYILLKDATGASALGTYMTGVNGTCFNSTYSTLFNSSIKPDHTYILSINSTNERGSSPVATIRVKSAKVFQFVVTSDSIQVVWPWALINFLVLRGNISGFSVSCCVETMPSCVGQTFQINGLSGQVNMSIGGLLNYTEYVFDFTLYVGKTSNVLGYLKGIRAGSNAIGSRLSVTTIALIVLFGVVVLASIGMNIGLLIWKRHQQLLTLPQASEDISDENYETINPYHETRASGEDPYSYESIGHKDAGTAGSNVFDEQTESEIHEMSCPSEFKDDDLLLA